MYLEMRVFAVFFDVYFVHGDVALFSFAIVEKFDYASVRVEPLFFGREWVEVAVVDDSASTRGRC